MRERAGEMPDGYAVGVYFNVCIPSLVSDLSLDLWSLYNHLSGTKNETFKSYIRLPAIYVEAVEIIEAELERIRRIREQNAK